MSNLKYPPASHYLQRVDWARAQVETEMLEESGTGILAKKMKGRR